MKIMGRYLFARKALASFWGLLLILCQAAADCQGQAAGYQDIFDDLIKLTPDSVSYQVKMVTIKRDAGSIMLMSGRITPAKPINGRVVALIFEGEGRFHFEPMDDVEKKQLARFYKTESIEDDFTSAVIVFTDDTYDSLKRDLRLSPKAKGDGDGTLLRKAIECLAREKGKYGNPHLMKGLLESQANGFFWAELRTKGNGPLFFSWDPFDAEEVSLSRLAKGLQFDRKTEVICQFPSGETRRLGGQRKPAEVTPLRIDRYRAECAIDKNLEVRIACAVTFVSQMENQQWLPLILDEELVLDSARWGGGQPLAAYKMKENPLLWVRTPQPISKDQVCSLTVYYHGDIIDKQVNWFFVKSSSSWYPRTEYWDRASFDVLFKVAEKYDFVSSFAPCSVSTIDGWKYYHVMSEEPCRNFGFTLGYFKRHVINDPRIAKVEVLYTAESNAEKQVGADVANSLAFFQKIFGPVGLKTFHVTETPIWGGVAYPGLINLSWATFQRLYEEEYSEMLRAHEVSHQWWGVGVDFETYHDHWLCEGLANFSGLLYLQKTSKDRNKYFQVLKEWRDELAGARKYLLKSGKEPGPIWLGYRNITSETEEDFDLIVYIKGAWVFHMLRNMMIDLNTMNEDRFIGLMSDFYNSYRGRNATTDDFKAMAQSYYGQGLDWFFNQWVRGTGIPRYQYALNYADEGGKCRAKIKIRQDGVPEDFQMVIPLEFEFEGKRYARLRVTAKGPMTVIELPLLPMAPKKVTFNLYESVLCTAEKVEWGSLN